MGQEKNSSQGFTLIAALLILVLLSGVAAGLLFMVTNESHMGGNDLEANRAFYGAESGMEKLTADLSALYAQYQVPTNTQIQNLINFPPTAAMVSGMTYVETITYPVNSGGSPVTSYNTVSAGSNQGLYAEIIPMTLQVIATRPEGASANITRKVEVALIPVFQFGVFCGYDCSYFAGPNFGFGGRVHTNQNLFLASGADLVFNDKLSAFQQIVMDQLENGNPTTAGYPSPPLRCPSALYLPLHNIASFSSLGLEFGQAFRISNQRDHYRISQIVRITSLEMDPVLVHLLRLFEVHIPLGTRGTHRLPAVQTALHAVKVRQFPFDFEPSGLPLAFRQRHDTAQFAGKDLYGPA